jgi:hypothetical protein
MLLRASTAKAWLVFRLAAVDAYLEVFAAYWIVMDKITMSGIADTLPFPLTLKVLASQQSGKADRDRWMINAKMYKVLLI